MQVSPKSVFGCQLLNALQGKLNWWWSWSWSWWILMNPDASIWRSSTRPSVRRFLNIVVKLWQLFFNACHQVGLTGLQRNILCILCRLISKETQHHKRIVKTLAFASQNVFYQTSCVRCRVAHSYRYITSLPLNMYGVVQFVLCSGFVRGQNFGD